MAFKQMFAAVVKILRGKSVERPALFVAIWRAGSGSRSHPGALGIAYSDSAAWGGGPTLSQNTIRMADSLSGAETRSAQRRVNSREPFSSFEIVALVVPAISAS